MDRTHKTEAFEWDSSLNGELSEVILYVIQNNKNRRWGVIMLSSLCPGQCQLLQDSRRQEGTCKPLLQWLWGNLFSIFASLSFLFCAFQFAYSNGPRLPCVIVFLSHILPCQLILSNFLPVTLPNSRILWGIFSCSSVVLLL